MRWVATPLVCIALVGGCGGDDNEDAATPTVPTVATSSTVATTTRDEPPSGPMVRICDRRLAAEVTAALREQGFRHLGSKPTAGGNPRLSDCEIAGREAEVSISLDRATDAVRRYHNRVTESAQFSGGDPENAPHTVKGIGDRRLGGAGANWLPRTHLLLSARGERVLVVVDVSAEPLSDPRLLEAAKTISLAAWDRLER